MQTIRSFVAIPLSKDISVAAAKMIKRLRPLDEGIKWVPPDHLHLTLKFLGEVDNVEIPAVCDAVRRVVQPSRRFGLRFAAAGGFPNLQKPRVLYAGVEDPSGELVRIVGQLESALAELGFKPEPRDYTPHLTLGRARNRSHRLSEPLAAMIDQLGDCELGEMTVETVQLVASFLDRSGPTYQVMDTVPLTGN